MTIENICDGDVAACLSIYGYYITDTCVTCEEAIPSIEEFTERVKRITAKYPFLVAKENGKVIGYAYLDAFNPRSAYRITADLSIYLDKDCARHGTGTALYREIENLARAQGVENIISIITATNENSIRFHEKNGFSCVGTLENVAIKFGQPLSVKYYQKRI